jgi:hypothetical protein
MPGEDEDLKLTQKLYKGMLDQFTYVEPEAVAERFADVYMMPHCRQTEYRS